MANKTFVAKNGLTANTANVYFSQLATNLTPTAGGLILFADSTGKIGTRTEAQILSDIGGVASGTEITAITAGDGMHADTATTSGSAAIKLGVPTTLTVATTSGISAGTHAHEVAGLSDTSGGQEVFLQSDSSGDLKVASFSTGAALTVGTDLTVKDDISLDSDSAVLGFGDDNEVTLTHVHNSGLTLNSTNRLNFGDAATYVHQSADAALDVVSDGSVNVTTGAAGVVLKGTTPKLTIGDAGAEDTFIVFDGNATDIRMGIDDSSDLFEIGTGATHATTPAITIDTSQIVNFPNNPKLGGTAITSTAAELNLLDGVSGLVQADFTKLAAVDSTAAELNLLDGVTATTAELNYLDVTTLGTSEASKACVVDGNGDLIIPDSDKFGFGAANDMQLYHDGTNSYITNKTGALKVATETSGIAVTIGHTTSETTVADNLTVTGNALVSGDLTVSGTTTTVSSSTINVADPLVALATNNNAADAVDIGIYGLYDTSGSLDLYAGLFRDADDSGKWKLFKDSQAAPTTTVNIGATGYAVGTLVANIEGNVTGNVTGNINGALTGTLQTAAQGNVTSLGTLTTLTVDNVLINGTTIGHTGDTDLLTLASAALTLKGTLTVGVDDAGHDVKLFGDAASAFLLWDSSDNSLETAGAATINIVQDKLLIGGTAVTTTAAELNLLDGVSGLVKADLTKLAAVDSTAAELNIVDGGTSATATTLVAADRVVVNDAGAMVQVAMSDFETFMESNLDTLSSVTTVGALDSGSITSGFTSIDVGAGAISTTGVVTGGSVVITNESTIGSAGDTNSVIIGATGTVALTQNETLIGASNSSVGVATTQAFSGTIGTSATEAVFTFKAADGTASPTGATNYMGGEIVMSLKSGATYETKKIMIHHDGDPSADGSDVFFTEYATLGTEIGETLATAMGDADGTGLTTNQDKHVQFKITNPSGTAVLQYSGVAHLVEVPGDS